MPRMNTPWVLLATGSLALASVSCGAHLDAKVSASASISVGTSGGYAAMEEVPVVGGELRLAEPLPAFDASATDLAPGATVEPATGPAIAFPLQHTAVHVDVAGMMAIYTVEQTFENPYHTPIEAVYVFPLGDEAAVSSYAITIGERTIAGEIQEREAARAIYEEAREAGHTAALLEQEKPNVFAQRIANIAPRETIKVRFSYVELVDRVDGQSQIVFPLVVGPRYLPQDGNVGRHPVSSHVEGTVARTGTTAVSYIEDTRVGSTVSFTADIDAGVPIGKVDSPSHDLDVKDVSATRMHVELVRADEIPNRDLVVRFQAGGDRTQVGLLAHRTGDDGYFVLVVEPKENYRTGDVAAREVILLIDTSGSMEGVPLDQARAMSAAILGSLADRDTFNVLAFSDSMSMMAEQPIRGDAAGKRTGEDFIMALQAGGGTEMNQALLETLSSKPAGQRLRMVYMLSDGFVGNDDIVIEAAAGVLGHNRLFPIGIGSAPNRYLLDRLGLVGRGFTSYIGVTEDAYELAPEVVRRSAFPYMTDVAIDWGNLEVTDVTPTAIPDVYAGAPLIVSGRYTAPGNGEVTLTATTAGRRLSIPLQVSLPEDHRSEPVAQLFARRRIEALMMSAGAGGPSDSVKASVTRLGLSFHLVTEFTSFVAVDKARVVDAKGTARVVVQPAAIPEGVNLESAVSAEEVYAATSSGSSSSSSYDDTSSGYSGGGGWSGGGDADPLTLLLALALLPLGYGLRRWRTA